jgi:hypothetical protein
VAETSADQLLRALYTGQPISGDEGRRLLTAATGQAIAAATAAISAARGRVPNRERAAFWITGQPGNGKTQSLKQLVAQLPTTPGVGKYALATIDFDKEPDARRHTGLVPAIVRQCVFSGVAIGGLDEARKAAREGKGTDPSRIEAWAFGADVVGSLAGLPPVSLLASRGFKWFLGWLRPQGWYIRRNLRKQWGDDPQVVEFLGAWADYLLMPTRDGEAQFAEYLSKLATTNRLFDLFGFALQKSGYTTVALVFDEVTNDAVNSLKALWDPQVNPSPSIEQNLAEIAVATSALNWRRTWGILRAIRGLRFGTGSVAIPNSGRRPLFIQDQGAKANNP